MTEQFNPIWTNIAAGVVGFASAIFAEPLRRWIFSPSLELHFSSGSPYVVDTPELAQYQNPGQPVPVYSNHRAIYIRLKVLNVARTMAKGCRPYLIAIEVQDAAGNFSSSHYADSIPLAWACQDGDSAWQPMDLAKGVNQFVDLVSTRQIMSDLKPAIRPLPARYEDLFVKPAVYRYTVQIACENSKPVVAKVVVDWQGQWDKISARPN